METKTRNWAKMIHDFIPYPAESEKKVKEVKMKLRKWKPGDGSIQIGFSRHGNPEMHCDRTGYFSRSAEFCPRCMEQLHAYSVVWDEDGMNCPRCGVQIRGWALPPADYKETHIQCPVHGWRKRDKNGECNICTKKKGGKKI